MPISISELQDFEALAHEATGRIARALEPGMSEQDAASLLREWLKQQGINDHLHRPLAWFGERTALNGRSGWLPRPGIRPDYFPGPRTLRDGMAVSLYCAPLQGPLTAESMLCTSIGPNPDYAGLIADSQALKQRLANGIAHADSVRQLEAMMDRFAAGRRLRLRHRQPPMLDWVRPWSISPDTGYASERLVDKLAQLAGTPMPAHLPTSQVPFDRNQPLADGLWVIQPWLLRGQRGAGLRAIIHVSAGQARWLNDDWQDKRAIRASA